ncbi:MAG: zinc ribbon domain-containing protein [Acidobacteria bacterium]|nr:zinc ribbon domain-containing protein [Acidobacteriota bacterium]
MFCPKCGTKNPEDGKFCRSCGVDIGVVSKALTRKSKSDDLGLGMDLDSSMDLFSGEPEDERRRSDPAEVYGDAIKAVISGIGFLVVAIVLQTTGVAGGRTWWWAMLFPAFTFLGKGISDLLKSRKMEQLRALRPGVEEQTRNLSATTNAELPAASTEFVSPESRYRTGELMPPSVVEGTTRHLEVNKEGETMTLPKRD